MNRKSFWIPVGWDSVRAVLPQPGPPRTPQLSLNSKTLVLGLPHGLIKESFEIERIPGSWSPHVPEKKPKYRVSWGEGRWRRGEVIELEPVQLATVGSGRDILIPLQTNRTQTCINHKGLLHGIYLNRAGEAPQTYCGESPYISIIDHRAGKTPFVERSVPTCKACLVYKAVWCLFTVFEFEDKRVVLKKERKERSAEEKRLRLPTAYARILDDDLFENPTYKPGKKRVLPEIDVDETEDYLDTERDRKRSAAIDRTRRLEESKARVQGHRR